MEEKKEKRKPGTKINSKKKGSEYELKIAKVLSRWWGEEFHRTPMSGGLHWKADNRVAGDIVTPPNSVYPWVTELKKREAWEFNQFIKGTGEIEKYWEQVCSDANRTGLAPLLIFSKNYEPNYMMMSKHQFDALMNAALESKGCLPPINYFVVHKHGWMDRVVCILDDFIAHVSKQDVVAALNL